MREDYRHNSSQKEKKRKGKFFSKTVTRHRTGEKWVDPGMRCLVKEGERRILVGRDWTLIAKEGLDTEGNVKEI